MLLHPAFRRAERKNPKRERPRLRPDVFDYHVGFRFRPNQKRRREGFRLNAVERPKPPIGNLLAFDLIERFLPCLSETAQRRAPIPAQMLVRFEELNTKMCMRFLYLPSTRPTTRASRQQFDTTRLARPRWSRGTIVEHIAPGPLPSGAPRSQGLAGSVAQDRRLASTSRSFGEARKVVCRRRVSASWRSISPAAAARSNKPSVPTTCSPRWVVAWRHVARRGGRGSAVRTGLRVPA